MDLVNHLPDRLLFAVPKSKFFTSFNISLNWYVCDAISTNKVQRDVCMKNAVAY